jgi:hypothetical protein
MIASKENHSLQRVAQLKMHVTSELCQAFNCRELVFLHHDCVDWVKCLKELIFQVIFNRGQIESTQGELQSSQGRRNPDPFFTFRHRKIWILLCAGGVTLEGTFGLINSPHACFPVTPPVLIRYCNGSHGIITPKQSALGQRFFGNLECHSGACGI